MSKDFISGLALGFMICIVCMFIVAWNYEQVIAHYERNYVPKNKVAEIDAVRKVAEIDAVRKVAESDAVPKPPTRVEPNPPGQH